MTFGSSQSAEGPVHSLFMNRNKVGPCVPPATHGRPGRTALPWLAGSGPRGVFIEPRRLPTSAIVMKWMRLSSLTLALGTFTTAWADADPASFGSDLAFLRRHVPVVLLRDRTGDAQVALVPAYQGRVRRPGDARRRSTRQVLRTGNVFPGLGAGPRQVGDASPRDAAPARRGIAAGACRPRGVGRQLGGNQRVAEEMSVPEFRPEDQQTRL